MKLQDKLALIPTNPGCYLMMDDSGEIIYVGKAKNLKNRVRSYFTGAHNLKTTKLISEIDDFSYVITKTETEALILELHLIKEHTPKYNIKLMDDATYPYIVITNEKHPRIVVSRDPKKKYGTYFGPYPSVYSAKETVRLLNTLYPLRKCETLPKRVCLYYHIGQCLAPCIHEYEIDYEPILNEIKAFLKGDTKNVLNTLKSKMEEASLSLEYEKALEYKNLIDHITTTTEKQVMSLNDFKDRDFIAYHEDTEDIALQILKMRSGKVIDARSEVFPKYINAADQVLSFLLQYYETYPMPDELYFSDNFDLNTLSELFKNKAIIPKRGDKKHLIDIASKNALHDLEHQRLLLRSTSIKHEEALSAFDELLNIKRVNRIDIFDNAHLFGANPISVMVVYKDGMPARKEYRKYHLKKTSKMDDYGAFKEVLYRRYQRMLLEDLERPDLIIVDGGKGQVNAALEIINALHLEIPIVGLSKNHKHELESLVYQNKMESIKKNTYLYQYLSGMSDEVHRFAIDFHKQSRKKTTFKSILDDIPGVGPKRKQKLLKKFVTTENMINATIDMYEAIGIGKELAITIKTHLKASKDEKDY